VASLANANPTTTSFIEASRRRGAEIQWQQVPYEDISYHLKLAVVVAEDISFFDHRGFDTGEMARAVRDAVNGKRLRGASTITQQLAKNLWLTPSRSPLRKLREAVLTWQLERALGKRRILELYLNVVEFGPGVHGAKAASHRYFECEPLELDPDQSAELAAALSRPSVWHPGSPARGYRRQVERIRSRMARAGWLEQSIGLGGTQPGR
jgi:monofunctional biosynthetic peptidoglycan transglycosylase